MIRVLLKRNGSTTKSPLKESLSLIRTQLLEEKKEADALVEQFLSKLREAGIKIIRNEGRSRRGNHFRLERGNAGVEVSLHLATQGGWGVTENYVKNVEKWGDHWGIVFLALEGQFWVEGRNFRTLVTGDLAEANGYNVHLARLKASPSLAIPFSSVQEFLSKNGLR